MIGNSGQILASSVWEFKSSCWREISHPQSDDWIGSPSVPLVNLPLPAVWQQGFLLIFTEGQDKSAHFPEKLLHLWASVGQGKKIKMFSFLFHFFLENLKLSYGSHSKISSVQGRKRWLTLKWYITFLMGSLNFNCGNGTQNSPWLRITYWQLKRSKYSRQVIT